MHGWLIRLEGGIINGEKICHSWKKTKKYKSRILTGFMKKIFAREFLWFLFTIVLAVPLAFIFLLCLDLISESSDMTEDEKIFVVELFILSYIISFVGIYLIRLITYAIKVALLPPSEK